MLLHISLMYTSNIVVLSKIYLYIASKMSLVSFIQCYYFKSIITPQLSNYQTTRYGSYNILYNKHSVNKVLTISY